MKKPVDNSVDEFSICATLFYRLNRKRMMTKKIKIIIVLNSITYTI